MPRAPVIRVGGQRALRGRKLVPHGPVIMWSSVGNWKGGVDDGDMSGTMGRRQANNVLTRQSENEAKRFESLAAAEGDGVGRSAIDQGYTNIDHQRNDWARGRRLEQEERSAGILTTLIAAEQRQYEHHAHHNKKKQREEQGEAVMRVPMPRLPCAVKADVGDWQGNELDNLTGDPIQLTRRPKGAWSKLQKAFKTPVETNKDEEWHLPFKHYAPFTVDYGGYVKRFSASGVVPVDQPILKFSVYRESTGVDVLRRRLRSKLGLNPDDHSVLFSGGTVMTPANEHQQGSANAVSGEMMTVGAEDGSLSGESFGAVCQLGSCIGLPNAALLPHASRHYNLRPIIFNPLGFVGEEGLQAVMPLGTSFGRGLWSVSGDGSDQLLNNGGISWRILLRCVRVNQDDPLYPVISPDDLDSSPQLRAADAAIKARLKRLNTHGFINYFSIKKFGITANQSHHIATALGQGNYYSACCYWLQSEAERHPVVYRGYLKYLAESSSTGQGGIGGPLDSYGSQSTGTTLLSLCKALHQARAPQTTQNFIKTLSRIHLGSFDHDQSSATHDQAVYRMLWETTGKHAMGAVASGGASFIWNAMASQRMFSYGPRVVVGDIVAVCAGTGHGLHHESSQMCGSVKQQAKPADRDINFRIVTDEAMIAAASLSIFDVVLPMPEYAVGADAQKDQDASRGGNADSGCLFPTHNVNRALYQQMIRDHSLAAACNAQRGSQPMYRRLVERPVAETLRAVTVHDPSSLTVLKTDLFLRQERGTHLSSALTTDRIRTPCMVNQSPALRDRLAPVIDYNDINNRDGCGAVRSTSTSNDSNELYSVALSVELPRGVHIHSMLREVFDVRHCHFHDLLTPS